MHVIFRTDASIKIGQGHLHRCLSLASKIRSNGGTAEFMIVDQPGNAISLLDTLAFPYQLLPSNSDQMQDADATIGIISAQNQKPDWVVVDHYQLDASWHQKLKNYTNNILVIDDMHNKACDCSVILNQNYYSESNDLYKNLVPETCQKRIGPQYALLRDEFNIQRANVTFNFPPKRLLISFGGSDEQNVTAFSIHAISQSKITFDHIDVVVGVSNPNFEEIKMLCDKIGCHFHYNASNLAQLMVQADLALGAPGSTTWERCCLGLPSILISLAQNQVGVAEQLNDVVHYLGYYSEVGRQDIVNAITTLSQDETYYRLLHESGKKLVDGKGCDRVYDVMRSRV